MVCLGKISNLNDRMLEMLIYFASFFGLGNFASRFSIIAHFLSKFDF